MNVACYFGKFEGYLIAHAQNAYFLLAVYYQGVQRPRYNGAETLAVYSKIFSR